MPLPPEIRLRDAIRTMRDLLREAGVDSPRLTAELLLAHVRGATRGELLAQGDDSLSDAQHAQLTGFLKRRLNREPLAYILGTRDFYGREFIIRPGLLVPRPESETLIDEALVRLDRGARLLCADIGSGCGCLAVTLACEFSRLRILAIDIDPLALKVSRLNAEKLGVGSRVWCATMDRVTGIEARGRFDLIVSNPPYVDPADREGLQPEVRDHEPDLALYSGRGGRAFAEDLLPEVHARLKPGGLALFEFGERQGKTLAAASLECGFSSAEIARDLSGLERVLAAVK